MSIFIKHWARVFKSRYDRVAWHWCCIAWRLLYYIDILEHDTTVNIYSLFNYLVCRSMYICLAVASFIGDEIMQLLAESHDYQGPDEARKC